MTLPDYIGIRDQDKKFNYYMLNIYEDGLCVSTSKVKSDEALLDEIENVILRGYTFEVFEVNSVPIEYEDEDGLMRVFKK